MTKMLDGKSVVVTGAGRGIGREIALNMAAHGAKVVVNDRGVGLDGSDESDAPASEVVKEIEAAGGEAVADFGSVSEAAEAEAMVAKAVEAFGKIDIVVNNAGILRDVIFHKMTFEEWDAVIKVHLYGSFNVSRAAATHFRKQESGAFVHMTSTSGLVGNPGQANYSAAKMGIVGLSKSLALDMARFNVRSNCISPFAWSARTRSSRSSGPAFDPSPASGAHALAARPRAAIARRRRARPDRRRRGRDGVGAEDACTSPRFMRFMPRE